jgi:hypothetical protein
LFVSVGEIQRIASKTPDRKRSDIEYLSRLSSKFEFIVKRALKPPPQPNLTKPGGKRRDLTPILHRNVAHVIAELPTVWGGTLSGPT